MSQHPPHQGDVVIHRQGRSPGGYVLSRFEEPLQCSFLRYQQALQHAQAFAQLEHLDVWYTTDESRYVRVVVMRALTATDGP